MKDKIINLDEPFFIAEAQSPAIEKIRRQLAIIRPEPGEQLEWLIERLAEIGQVSADELRQTVLNKAMKKFRNRKVRVRAYERKK